jgi:hypothetical protein
VAFPSRAGRVRRRAGEAGYLLLRMTCNSLKAGLTYFCGCKSVAKFAFAFREVLDVRLQL